MKLILVLAALFLGCATTQERYDYMFAYCQRLAPHKVATSFEEEVANVRSLKTCMHLRGWVRDPKTAIQR